MNTLHKSTFAYIKPTDNQMTAMNACRAAAMAYVDVLDQQLPNGPDKTFVMRQLRTVAMWANVAVTRMADGTPRTDEPGEDPNA